MRPTRPQWIELSLVSHSYAIVLFIGQLVCSSTVKDKFRTAGWTFLRWSCWLSNSAPVRHLTPPAVKRPLMKWHSISGRPMYHCDTVRWRGAGSTLCNTHAQRTLPSHTCRHPAHLWRVRGCLVQRATCTVTSSRSWRWRMQRCCCLSAKTSSTLVNRGDGHPASPRTSLPRTFPPRPVPVQNQKHILY